MSKKDKKIITNIRDILSDVIFTIVVFFIVFYPGNPISAAAIIQTLAEKNHSVVATIYISIAVLVYIGVLLPIFILVSYSIAENVRDVYIYIKNRKMNK